MPPDELRQCVETARDVFSETFDEVVDGVQSNLIASKRRILALDTLFAGRVGTSVDGRGYQRTINGSAQSYRTAVSNARDTLKNRRRRSLGSVFVVDRAGLQNVLYELEQATSQRYPLVLRPVFKGGRSIDPAPLSDLISAYLKAFDAWAMTSNVPVSPFTYLLSGRLGHTAQGAMCPFQKNCSEVSLNIEPDGTLYTCYDMADSEQFPLGNAIHEEFDWETWEMLRARKTSVDSKCTTCPYFQTCQGGCMSEAIHHTGRPYGRSDLCALWTALFQRIDQLISMRGKDEVLSWFRTVER